MVGEDLTDVRLSEMREALKKRDKRVFWEGFLSGYTIAAVIGMVVVVIVYWVENKWTGSPIW